MITLKTMTGIPVSEVPARMKAILPPQAYKEIKGNSAGLTDINPAYLTEVSTEVFGLLGYGWTYDYDPADLEMTYIKLTSKNGREYDNFTVIIKRFLVSICLTDGEKEIWTKPFPVTGGSDNEAIENAYKGAITSALGHAFSRLCWQLDVYKGLLSHTNAAQEWQKRNGKQPVLQTQGTQPGTTLPPSPKQSQPAPTNGTNGNGHTPAPAVETPPLRYQPVALRNALVASANSHSESGVKVKDADRNMIAVNLEACFAGDPDRQNKRKTVTNYLFGVDSTKNLNDGMVTALKNWLKVTKDSGGEWRPDEMAAKEARAVYTQALIDEGQKQLI